MQTTSRTERFNELFYQLEHCDEDEQRKKIGEINEIFDGMEEEEFESFFTKEMFNRIDEMIEENKLTIENAILLLKCIGHCNSLKKECNLNFEESLLSERFEKMTFEEDYKNEKEKNENLLVGLCECLILLVKGFISEDLIATCVPHLLKVPLKKEESEETRKEVEMAFLALSCIDKFTDVEQELYLNEIKEIIEYHQEHHNLSRLAYQCAWEFLIFRLWVDYNLSGNAANELHLVREARRELDELTRNVDWRRKGDEMSRGEKKRAKIIIRWIQTLDSNFYLCSLLNEEYVGLFSSIVQVFRAAKENFREICCKSIDALRKAARNRTVKVEGLLKGGVIDIVLDEIYKQTMDDETAYNCLIFFMEVSLKLKIKTDDEMKEVKRKATKRKVFEKLEEEGYEDTITTFHKIFDYLYRKYYRETSLNISDYLVYV
ncbi:uncharacterized protein MONOS_4864 [Monocercomonoides exilis]|uniref:uncharacterized protein n=1 Tax=Monocercomonoides exilis TaxID=2049356 RepID=UPI0035594B25|nr:hypothetical protein MONOS_4864 [Monocercomonoides exilis]|eukprot:MONOS_4864.1-p1 / transcript=MONOS_4864.1 / gene=MONOS_4864 / organism=Monocercomonoides_exilis_PA203 / gene_product=unspecified product / transcript_product=unspecified product / location=Mono_scaffold00135:94058-95500(+) / protein_length=433 / sequence_SO=supercontig / SO=protein_coding / is_pseudo=false